MSGDRPEAVARALAWAFLAAPEWTPQSLAAAAAETLGRRFDWVNRVVVPVLAAYRSAPVDRPHELARFLLAATPLSEILAGAAVQTIPIRVVTVMTVPGRMGTSRWPVPEIDDLSDLATVLEVPLDQLLWAADLGGLQRRTPPGPLHLYRYRWLTRAGAVPRLLESPTPLLRALLRRLLSAILRWVPVHPAAHGFVTGRSALTNATLHVGAGSVACFDLRTFFADVRAGRVNGLFRAMGYPEAVAATLTGLATHRTPTHVLARLPAGGSSQDRHRLRAALRSRHLPQGAPTSPALANLACFTLDTRLAAYAAAAGLTYTRYADDLCFSGTELATPALVRAVDRITRAEGFVLNRAKTRIRSAGQRRQVTGLVINERLSVPRGYHDQLRAVLHDAERHGPEAANRSGHPDFRSQLAGRVGWVESVSPARGRRLRAQFDAIVWPAEPGRGRWAVPTGSSMSAVSADESPPSTGSP